jgi:hypothetical protein
MSKLVLKGLLLDLPRQQKAEALASACKIYSLLLQVAILLMVMVL